MGLDGVQSGATAREGNLTRLQPGSSDGKESAAMQETRVLSLGQEDFPEKEMAIHASILAWRIPWMEEPGRIQSTGSQTVTYD